MNNKAFTKIELVMIIVVLGILAVVAIPRYVDLRIEARKAAADGVVGSGNDGAQHWQAMYLIDSTIAPYTTQYPPTGSQCFEDGTVPSVSGATFNYDPDTGTWSYTLN